MGGVKEKYKAPDVTGKDLTPALARDELLKCFESANREFYEILDQPMGGEALKQQVRQFVTGVFSQCGVSFDRPTKAGIMTAIEQCKKNAESTMGPRGASIISEHYEEMMKLLSRLPE
jgi:hypothetical protein